ncbi:MAG: hypothetical protein WCH35_15440 [Comamonadaceae bacterium]
MTQHINLLASKKNPAERVTRELLAPLAAVFLLLLALWAWRQSDEIQVRRADQTALQQLEQTRASLTAKLPQQSGQDLVKQIAALRPKAQAAQMMMSKLADLGSQQGYSGHFAALAGISETGVWLNKVEVTQGGKLVSLSGRALDKAAVLAYVNKLNARFAELGVEFKALEITSETLAGKAGDAGSALNVVAFKLN